MAALLASEMDLDVIGHPRLVRLNPNVPWKTRGNGAVSLVLGIGDGTPERVGAIDGADIVSFPRASVEQPGAHVDDVLHAASGLVEELAVDHPETRPGLVVSPSPLPPALYWNAVRDVVELADVEAALDALSASHRGWNGGRGVIGAAAAIAWPASDVTYEATAYRRRERWGTRREVDLEAARTVDGRYGTFSTSDPATGRVMAVPNTPCPVLMGVRANDPVPAAMALASIPSEEPSGRIVWATNHATDDHVVDIASVSLARSLITVRLDGTVARPPVRGPGGHVIAAMADGTGSIDLAAFEPTGALRDVVGSLVPGDAVTAVGAVRDGPMTINLEKLLVREAVDRYIKVENPTCKSCRVRMKSRGRDAGYRCPRCGSRVAREAAPRVRAGGPQKGWYEAAPSAQRHLTMPLNRPARCIDGGVLRGHRGGGPEDL